MKKTFFKLLLIFSVIAPNAWGNSPFPTKEQVGMFLNSTTCFVLEKNPIAYNLQLKAAVEKSWKLTDYEFIDRAEFENRRKNSKYSFMFISKLGFEDEDITYNILNLTLGEETDDLAEMPEFCAIPVSYSDDQTLNYGYAFGPMLLFMQNRVEEIQKKYLMMSVSSFKIYNKNTKKVRDFELLIDEQDLSEEFNGKEDFKNSYNGVADFLSKEEIEKKIADKSNTILFLHVVKPLFDDSKGRCYKMIFSNKGELYYYNYHYIDKENPSGFLKGDLNSLN